MDGDDFRRAYNARCIMANGAAYADAVRRARAHKVEAERARALEVLRAQQKTARALLEVEEKQQQEAKEKRMTERSGEPESEIGYGNPPPANQFTKGQSGNPKGRPKGRSINDMVMKYATQGLSVRKARERGLEPGATRMDVVIDRLVQLAEAGHTHERKELLSLYRQIEAPADAEEVTA